MTDAEIEQELQWEDTGPISGQQHDRYLRTAVLVSLLLHSVIVLLISGAFEVRSRVEPVAATAVRIRLLPATASSDSPSSVSDITDAPPEDFSVQPASGLSDTQPVPRGGFVVDHEAVSTERVEVPTVSADPPMPAIDLPSVVETPTSSESAGSAPGPRIVPDSLTVRRTVRNLQEQQRVSSADLACSDWQRRNRLLNCSLLEQTDYSQSLTNPVYLSLNPPPLDNQARRLMGTVGRFRDQLQTAVEEDSPASVTGDYLLEELNLGREVYSATGNARLERLSDQMQRNDPAYQLQKRIMTPR